MANEKMPPISAILSELKRHCENSWALREEIIGVQLPIRKQILKEEEMCENTSIVALCNVLEITAIPDEEVSTVILELEALRSSRDAVFQLIKKLKRS